jgi:hypothetical protein
MTAPCPGSTARVHRRARLGAAPPPTPPLRWARPACLLSSTQGSHTYPLHLPLLQVHTRVTAGCQSTTTVGNPRHAVWVLPPVTATLTQLEPTALNMSDATPSPRWCSLWRPHPGPATIAPSVATPPCQHAVPRLGLAGCGGWWAEPCKRAGQPRCHGLQCLMGWGRPDWDRHCARVSIFIFELIK